MVTCKLATLSSAFPFRIFNTVSWASSSSRMLSRRLTLLQERGKDAAVVHFLLADVFDLLQLAE